MHKRKLDKTIPCSFPYVDQFVSREELLDVYRYVYQKRNELYTTKESELDTFLISGYQVSPIRSMCQRSDEHISPYTYFMNNYQSLVAESQYNSKVMDQLIWKEIKGCGAFPVQWALYMYEKHKPERVLDPCSGWGDRLIAASLSSTVRYYCGVDPHLPLKYHYQRFLDRLKPPNLDCKFIQDKFENVKLLEIRQRPGTKFNMIITSPPYSTLEEYGSKDERSEEQWKKKFLYPMLDRSWDFLTGGGVLVLFMPGPNVNYVSSTIRYMETLTLTLHQENNLGPSHAYTWTKELGETMAQDVSLGNVDEEKKIIYSGSPSYTKRALERYLNMYSEDILDYVAIGKDQAMDDLIKENKHFKKINIYYNERDKEYVNILMRGKGTNKIYLHSYSGDYKDKLRSVREDPGNQRHGLVTTNFNDAEFSSCLKNIVGLSLFKTFRKPFRVWIFDVTLSLTEAFLDALSLSSVILYMPHRTYKLEDMNVEDRRRVSMFYVDSVKEFEETYETLASEGDYILRFEEKGRKEITKKTS